LAVCSSTPMIKLTTMAYDGPSGRRPGLFDVGSDLSHSQQRGGGVKSAHGSRGELGRGPVQWRDDQDTRNPPSTHRLWPTMKEAALALMHDDYAQRLSLEQMGRAADLTPIRLIGLFNKSFGLTPHAYLTQLRLKAAIRNLRAGRMERGGHAPPAKRCSI
jgi:AraC-like DNA-binding protein